MRRHCAIARHPPVLRVIGFGVGVYKGYTVFTPFKGGGVGPPHPMAARPMSAADQKNRNKIGISENHQPLKILKIPC